MLKIDNKIVMFGMSCSGKTTFANHIVYTNPEYYYYCFDAMFDWHSIETLGLSASTNLKAVSKKCISEKYVLDGWHLADKEGNYLPEDCTVYVVYADYNRVINQYRIEVKHPEEYRSMFNRWYFEIPYFNFPRVRYWENVGYFLERSEKAYKAFLERS